MSWLDETQPGLHYEVPYGDTLHGWYITRRTKKYKFIDQKPHPYRDRESLSYLETENIGSPRMHEISTSYEPLTVREKISTEWRPYSKLSTFGVTAPCSKSHFDRTYSRSYMRPYSKPYNISERHVSYSYDTSYHGPNDKDRYGNIGSYQRVKERPRRDYQRIHNTLRVKEYQKGIVDTK